MPPPRSRLAGSRVPLASRPSRTRRRKRLVKLTAQPLTAIKFDARRVERQWKAGACVMAMDL